MPAPRTTPDRQGTRDVAPARMAFRVLERVGNRDIIFSWLHGWPAHSPADASLTSSRMPGHGSGAMCSLCLHRSGLSPPTPCRSPGALNEDSPSTSDLCVGEPAVPSDPSDWSASAADARKYLPQSEGLQLIQTSSEFAGFRHVYAWRLQTPKRRFNRKANSR